MIVCVCASKTEEEVRCAIREGCETLQKLKQEHCIGKDCERCVNAVKQLLLEEVK